MTASPQFGAPVRVTINGEIHKGTFAGLADRKHGRVRIGHTLKTFALSNIVEVLACGDRWATLHSGDR